MMYSQLKPVGVLVLGGSRITYNQTSRVANEGSRFTFFRQAQKLPKCFLSN